MAGILSVLRFFFLFILSRLISPREYSFLLLFSSPSYFEYQILDASKQRVKLQSAKPEKTKRRW